MDSNLVKKKKLIMKLSQKENLQKKIPPSYFLGGYILNTESPH